MPVKIRLRPAASIKCHVKPRFPTRVIGRNGIAAGLLGGVVIIEPAYGDQAAIATPIAAGKQDNTFLLAFDSDDDTYKRLGIDVLIASVSASLDPTLVAIAGLTPGADQAIYFTAADTAALFSLTQSGRALVALSGAADELAYFNGAGSAAKTALTAFARSILDDADAAAALTTLGISAFVQTILDDADAAAVRATIEAQASDATLTSLSALGTAADRIAYTTGIDTWAEAALTSFARSILDDADEAAFKATVNLEIGVDVQAYDAELAALAGLASAADKLPYFTGPGAAALADLTAFARTLLDDANAGAARTTLGVAIGTDVQAFSDRLAEIAGAAWAQGDILYFNGTNLVRLPAGVSGEFLKTLGPGGNPTWDLPAGSGDLLAANNLSDVDDPDEAADNIAAVSYSHAQTRTASERSIARTNIGAAAEKDLMVLELELAELAPDRITMPDGIVDGFHDLTDVDVAGATNLDAGEAGALKPIVTQTTTASATVSTSDAGWSGAGIRQVIGNAQISTSGSKVRVSFRAGTSAPLNITGAKIGHKGAGAHQFAGDQVALTFAGGSASGSVAANGTLVSDWVTFSLNEASDLVAAFIIGGSSSALYNTGAQTGWTAYDKPAGSDALDANPSGYTNSWTAVCVSLIEVQTATSNLTVRSNPFTAAYTPSRTRLSFVLRPDDAFTPNTNAIGKVSRDGGTTYTTATLALVTARTDGSLIYMADLDLSAQPSGNSMVWQYETAGNKMVPNLLTKLGWAP